MAIVAADGFDPNIAAQRAPRAAPRETRPRSARDAAGPAERPRTSTRSAPASRREEPLRPASSGLTRQEERERAYALNPDQPARPATAAGTMNGSLLTNSGPASNGSRHKQAVPALLMKRPIHEPEKV